SQGLAGTGVLFVDGRVFESYGVPVSHAWCPDRVLRSAELPGLAIETTTVCVPGETAVAIDIRVTNTGDAARTVTLTLAANARVTRADGSWTDAESPSIRNTVVVDDEGTRLVFADDDATAWSIQGLDRDGVA